MNTIILLIQCRCIINTTFKDENTVLVLNTEVELFLGTDKCFNTGNLQMTTAIQQVTIQKPVKALKRKTLF